MSIHGFPGILSYANPLFHQFAQNVTPRINACWQWVQSTRLWTVGCKPSYDRYIEPLDWREKQMVMGGCVVIIAIPLFTRYVLGSVYLPLSGLATSAVVLLTLSQIKTRVEAPLNLAVADEIPALLDAVRATTRQNALPQELNTFETQLKLPVNSHLKNESDYLEQLKRAFTEAHTRQQVIELKSTLSDYLAPIVAASGGHPIHPFLSGFKTAVDALGTPTQSIPDYRRTFNDLVQQQQTLNLTEQVQQQIGVIVGMKSEIDAVINQRSFVECRTQLANFLVQLYQQLNPTAPPLP